MVAQAVLHREILHVHAFLDHILTLLRTRLAILSPPFMERITSPHLHVQLRGLDSAIRQATQATHTALHYTHELMTTFGLIHTLNFDANQLEAELRGTTSFRDHRIPPPPPRMDTCPPSSLTATSSTPDSDFSMAFLHRTDSQSRTTTSTTRSPRGITVATTTRPHPRAGLSGTLDRSRSRSRLNPRAPYSLTHFVDMPAFQNNVSVVSHSFDFWCNITVCFTALNPTGPTLIPWAPA